MGRIIGALKGWQLQTIFRGLTTLWVFVRWRDCNETNYQCTDNQVVFSLLSIQTQIVFCLQVDPTRTSEQSLLQKQADSRCVRGCHSTSVSL